MTEIVFITVIGGLTLAVAALCYRIKQLKGEKKIPDTFYKDALYNLSIPLCVKNPYTQEVLYLNKAYYDTIVRHKEGVLTELSKLNLSKESFEQCIKVETALLKNKQPYDTYEMLKFIDGKVMDTYTSKSIINWDGVDSVLCIRYDLAKRRNSMNIDNLLSHTLPMIGAFSWVMDSRDNSITYKSRHAFLKSIDMYNTLERCLEVVHEEDREKYKQCIAKALKAGEGGGFFSTEYRSRTSEDKPYIWWEMRCFVKNEYYDGGHHALVHGINVYINDIKERERLLLDRTKELELSRKKAEESNRLKTEFLNSMSHEIRTPLNAIVGFSELLVESSDTEEKEEFSKLVRLNNNILLTLISDIIDLSKLESAVEMNIERGDFSKYFNKTANSLKDLSTNSAVEFIIENPFKEAFVNIDFTYITRIMTNFATNAIKNTTEGSITIGYLYQEDSELLEIYVRDTGIGIPEDKQAMVFDRFRKLDKFKQGVGLGLNIVKAIARQMDFECGFESTVDVGSYFYVRGRCPMYIPKQKEDNENNSLLDKNGNHLTIGSSEATDSPPIKIMVAEDVDSNFQLIKAFLSPLKLTRAINGIEAVRLAKEEDFDLILMDIKMPMMNGLEATREIKRMGKDITIVVLSANTLDTDKVDAYSAGCDIYLDKPIRKEKLLNLINNFIQNKIKA